MPVDIKSREFPNALIKALESQEGMDIAMSLKGEDASTLVDILDQVSKPPKAHEEQGIADVLNLTHEFESEYRR